MSSAGPFIRTDQPPLPEVTGHVAADVVVVGAGLAGTLTALYLARAGVDVVVLEATGRIGGGRSGRDFGQVETGVVEHPYRTVRSLGEQRALELFAMTDLSRRLLAQEGELETCGALWASTGGNEPADIDASVEALVGLGRRAERLQPDEVAERTGALGLGPALWLPDDGCVAPGASTERLAQKAQAAGARFFAGTARPASASEHEGVELVVGDALVRAEVAVFAAGAGARELDTRLADALLPVREQGLVATGASRSGLRLGRAGQGWTCWRWLDDERLAVCGSRWATPHLEVGEHDATVLEPRIQAKLEGFAAERFGATTVEQRWAWVFAQSKDGLPVIGPMPGEARKVVIAGLGPNGASLAPAAARAVVDGLLDGQGEVPRCMAATRMVGWR